MNDESSMMEFSKSEKLAAAKKKLREFESRKMNGGVSPISSVSSHHEQPNGRQSTVSNVSGSGYYDDHNGFNETSSNIEQRSAEVEQLRKQLAEMHAYYSQVHAAYNELAARSGENGMEASRQLNSQIVQLQSALSLLVEEKTELQWRLRSEHEKIERLEGEIEESRRTPLAVSSHETNGLREELIQAKKTVAGGLEELKNARMECAHVQSQARAMQQDKVEAQARLRSVYKEKEELEGTVKEMRKEMTMKDMHIRQLNAHHGGPATTLSLSDHDEELRGERNRMEEELENIRREATETMERHILYEKELSQRCTSLVQQIESMSHENAIVKERMAQLEDELESSLVVGDRKEKERQDNIAQADQAATVAVVGISEGEVERRVDETARRITSAFEERMKMEGEIQRRAMEGKEREIVEKAREVEELKLKLDLAERRIAEDASHSESLSSLLEELQNEKATVSRALSQNRELKEQVIELEDRLISLTQEKLECELSRQTLEHVLKSTENEGQSEEEKHTHGDCSLRERELERSLDDATTQLQQVREELRRSLNENNSMNQIMQQNGEDENQNSIVVELGQAIARVSALSEENIQLREELERERGGGQSNSHDTIQISYLEDELRMAEDAMERGRQAERRVEELERERQLMNGPDRERVTILEERLRLADEEAARLLREGTDKTAMLQEEKKKVKSTEERITEIEREVVRKEERIRMEKEGDRGQEGIEVQGDSRIEELMERLKEVESERDKLEHVKVALEQENETITDHVVLYQHYRRVMRERLGAKDEELRIAEEEREKMANSCIQLHNVLKSLLKEGGTRNGAESVNGEEGEESIQAVQRIYHIMNHIQMPSIRTENRFPKCTQCIGDTIIV